MLQCCAHLGRSRRGAPQEQPPSRPAQGRRDASEPPGPCLWGQFRPFRPPNGPRCGFSLRGMAAGSNLPRVWRPHVFGCEWSAAARGAAGCCCCCGGSSCWGGGAAALARAPDATARRWLPAPCRRARYRACGGVARLSELRVRGAPLLSAQLIHVVTTGELARKSAGLSCGIGRLVASCRRNCA